MRFQDITTAGVFLTIIISIYAVSKWWGEYQTGIGLEPDRDRDGYYMNSSHYDHGTSSNAGAIMVFTFIPQMIILFGIPMKLEPILPIWSSCLIEIIGLNTIYYYIIKSAWRMSDVNELECLKLNKDCNPYSDYVKYKVKQEVYQKYEEYIPTPNSYITYYNMTHKKPYESQKYTEDTDSSDDYTPNNRYNDDFRRR